MVVKKFNFLSVLFSLMLVSPGIVSADTLTIRPNAQGYYDDWVNVGCGSGLFEWQCVDEDPASILDYLYTRGKNKYESFAFQDSGLTSETINDVTLYFYGQEYSRSKYKFQPLIRSGSTNYLGSLKSLTSGYSYSSENYVNNPATGSAWTVSQIDALEAGMKSYSSNPGGKIAQVYAVVNYSGSVISDSCFDSDGGLILTTLGNVSGYLNQNYYVHTDFCIYSTMIREYSCS